MSFLHAIILGLVQGLGEFLPISSSGHLVIVPYIFGWDYQGLEFDVALHLGTALAVIIFFAKDWITIITQAISPEGKSNESSYPKSLLWMILVASIPAAIGGYFLEGLAEHALRNPLLVAGFLAIFALLLWLADSSDRNKEKIKDIGFGKSFIIGIAQAVSLFPGVSRSGITTTAGMFLNLDRESAMKFSFLLSTPAILGAALLTLKDLSAASINLPFITAFLVSAITGYLAIKYLLRYLQTHSFLPFVIYRLILAGVIVALYITR